VGLLKNFGVELPAALTSAPYRWCETSEVAKGVAGCLKEGLNPTGAIANIPAVIIVAIMSVVLVIGIKESATVNNYIVALKLGVIALFIIAGAFYINSANWHPFIPDNTGEFGKFGISGIFRGAGLIFFAYIGFDAVSTAAQEAKNPQKDMPIGILGSLGVCTVLYILVSGILTGIMPYNQLDVSHPVGFAVDSIPGLKWMGWIINLGAVLGLASVILVMLLGQSRVFFSMARDGLLPPWVGKVHPKFRTPYLTQIFVGIFAAFFTGLFPIQLLGELVNIGTLLAFVLVCIGIVILRRTRPDLNRPFKTPWVPAVPILGVISCAGLMATLPGDTWLRLFVWMAIGLVIYFMYGRRHSTLQTGADAAKAGGGR
jgi:APA family basic amino acid/polyamine antiporter